MRWIGKDVGVGLLIVQAEGKHCNLQTKGSKNGGRFDVVFLSVFLVQKSVNGCSVPAVLKCQWNMSGLLCVRETRIPHHNLGSRELERTREIPSAHPLDNNAAKRTCHMDGKVSVAMEEQQSSQDARSASVNEQEEADVRVDGKAEVAEQIAEQIAYQVFAHFLPQSLHFTATPSAGKSDHDLIAEFLGVPVSMFKFTSLVVSGPKRQYMVEIVHPQRWQDFLIEFNWKLDWSMENATLVMGKMDSLPRTVALPKVTVGGVECAVPKWAWFLSAAGKEYLKRKETHLHLGKILRQLATDRRVRPGYFRGTGHREQAQQPHGRAEGPAASSTSSSSVVCNLSGQGESAAVPVQESLQQNLATQARQAQEIAALKSQLAAAAADRTAQLAAADQKLKDAIHSHRRQVLTLQDAAAAQAQALAKCKSELSEANKAMVVACIHCHTLTHTICVRTPESLQSGLESEQQEFSAVKEELVSAFEEVKALKKVILDRI
eukprot:g27049.t1